jgi:hypothetical protein
MDTNTLVWHTSTYSNADGPECVEVAELPEGTAVRDTLNREAGHLAYPGVEWAGLLGVLKAR